MEVILQTGLLKLLPLPIAGFLIFYFLCKVLDFATGILKCLRTGGTGYKSSKMRDGIIKWVGELVAILFVLGLDILMGLNFILCGMTLSLFVFKEGGSIAENLKEMGVELPDAIGDKLEILNTKKKKEIEEKE